MDKLVFNINNRPEDYIAVYPELNKNSLFINRWTKYVFALFLLLLLISVFMSVKRPFIKEEFGYTATATTVILAVLAGMMIESFNKKKNIRTYVNNIVSKGAAQVTIDLVGIEIKYAREIKLVEWAKDGQLVLENNYLMFLESTGNIIALIPKGTITDNSWFEIQELTTSIIKLAATKRYGLNE